MPGLITRAGFDVDREPGGPISFDHRPAPREWLARLDLEALVAGDAVLAGPIAVGVRRTDRIRITGRNGAGKSTLVNHILYPATARALHRSDRVVGTHREIEGLTEIDKVIEELPSHVRQRCSTSCAERPVTVSIAALRGCPSRSSVINWRCPSRP